MSQSGLNDEQIRQLFHGWWGSFNLARGEVGHWRVGPMDMWLFHDQREWVMAYKTEYAPLSVDVKVELGSNRYAMPEGEEIEFQRYIVSDASGALYLQPTLADRPVISRPEVPLYLPGGEAVMFYVSSPLWLKVKQGDGLRTLFDRPIYRPSDTWYGPPTRRGGLGYATTTLARTSLDDFHYSPFRAITPILVRNNAHSNLLIEQINLPAPYLTLYQARNGVFWTQTMILERNDEDNQEMALLKLSRGAPLEEGVSTVVAESRRGADKNVVIRAFSRLFLN